MFTSMHERHEHYERRLSKATIYLLGQWTCFYLTEPVKEKVRDVAKGSNDSGEKQNDF
jgi:hypothetical protein